MISRRENSPIFDRILLSFLFYTILLNYECKSLCELFVTTYVVATILILIKFVIEIAYVLD